MTLHKGDNSVPTSRGRSEEDQARVLCWRIDPNVGDALVERLQHALLGLHSLQDDGISCALEALTDDRVRFVASHPKLFSKVFGQVLVDLELHAVRSGSRRSSRAHSAAYASAASMCSSRRP